MRTAYLTIDDAPGEQFMSRLDYLTKNRIPAVWFCEGQNIEDRFDYVVEAIRRDYIIGNHSWSHPHFSALSIEKAQSEILKTDAIIKKAYEVAGKKRDHKYFRFPYGDKGSTDTYKPIQNFLRKLGYEAPDWSAITYERFDKYRHDVDWYWTFDSVDYGLSSEDLMKKHETYDHDDVLERMDIDKPGKGFGLNSGSSAEIIGVHDHLHDDLIQKITKRLAEKGFEFRLP